MIKPTKPVQAGIESTRSPNPIIEKSKITTPHLVWLSGCERIFTPPTNTNIADISIHTASAIAIAKNVPTSNSTNIEAI